MSNIYCTITKSGRSNEYGQALLVGSSYLGTRDYVRDLVRSGYATVQNESIFDDDSLPMGDEAIVRSKIKSEILSTTAGGIQICHFKELADLEAQFGSIVYVDDIGAELVEFNRTPFGGGWKVARPFPLQPMNREYYTFTNIANDINVPWEVGLPAGLLGLGWIHIMFACDYTASTVSKAIDVRLMQVSDRASYYFFNVTRNLITDTHEAPLVVISTRDPSYLVNPFSSDNTYSAGSTNALSIKQGATVNPLAEDCTLSVRFKFTNAGSGNNTANFRFIRAIFYPF